jgi:Mn2+/Fe2+ NRAMP family transporter
MQLDALLAMVIYTVVTVAFYFLGAAVLNRQGLMPEGSQMIDTLSKTFTGIFGVWGYYVFLLGALVTLYSTLFASVAANAIMGLDCLTVFGFVPAEDPLKRIRWRRSLQVFWAAIYLLIFLSFTEQPVQLIVLGGMAQTGMLPVIAFSIIYLRYRRLDRRIGPSAWIDGLLWLSGGLTLCIALYTLVRHLSAGC